MNFLRSLFGSKTKLGGALLAIGQLGPVIELAASGVFGERAAVIANASREIVRGVSALATPAGAIIGAVGVRNAIAKNGTGK